MTEGGDRKERHDQNKSVGSFFDTVAYLIMIVGSFALVTTILRSLRFGNWQSTLLQALLYLAFVIIILLGRKRLPFAARAWVIIGIFWLYGLVGIFNWSLAGMGLTLLSLVVILAGIGAGRRGAMFMALVNMLLLGGVGFATVSGLLPLRFDANAYLKNPVVWVNAVITVTVLVGVIAYQLGNLTTYWRETIEQLRDRTSDLVREVAERQRAEKDLRASRGLLNTILGNVGAAIFTKDAHYRYTYVNQRVCEVFGKSQEEILGRGDDAFFSPAAVEEIVRNDRQVIERGETVAREEMGLTSADGTPRTYWTVKLPLRDDDGRVTGLCGISTEITELKKAEENVKQSEEKAKQLAQENAVIADIARIVSSTLDIDEVFESFAKEVTKVISFDRIVINLIDTERGTAKNVYIAGEGVPYRKVEEDYPLKGSGSAEMVRNQSSLLIQTEDFSEYQERFPMLLSTFQAGFRSILDVPLFSKGKIFGGLLFRSHTPHAYTDRDVRLAERIASHIAGAIANAQLYVEHKRSEEEKERLQAQLLQAQKMETVGRLAGGVAHDFNNMLQAILGHAEIASMMLEEDHLAQKHLKRVQHSAQRSANVVSQLLAFARKQTVSPKVLDLNDTVSGMLKMLKRLIGEDIDLAWVPSHQLWKVKIDPTQVDQILVNLVVNARDAIVGVGRITIETRKVVLDDSYCAEHPECIPGEYAQLAVSDNGAGMSQEVLTKLFEPFFTTKEVGKGTGLGLSTVYGIVKQNNGFIEVNSEPGKGTTFKIKLPRFEAEVADVQPESKEEPVRGGTETVLLVEDEELILDIVRQALEGLGYRVLVARKPSRAIQIAGEQSGDIHLLMTDVVMPEMNGRELAERISAIKPGLKFLYMSGYTANVIAHHGVLDEGLNFIHKPFSVKDLSRKVREALDKA